MQTLLFPVAADTISLYTQKLCMCCVASPDLDLDNIDPGKMEWRGNEKGLERRDVWRDERGEEGWTRSGMWAADNQDVDGYSLSEKWRSGGERRARRASASLTRALGNRINIMYSTSMVEIKTGELVQLHMLL